MKNTDLRIGNLVSYEQTTHVVTGIKGSKVYSRWCKQRNKLPEEEEYICDISELKPIKISLEVILKCFGIENDKLFTSFNVQGLQINYINKIWIEYVSRVEIKGLHHLQNIFYFRYGKELEIKIK